MNFFELVFRKFERQPQSDQLSITFNHSIELIPETMETADIDMNPSNSMIDPIVNRNFGNAFHHQNGPNQLITPPLDNSNITEALIKNISIDIIVNNINPDPSKYIENIQSHT